MKQRIDHSGSSFDDYLRDEGLLEEVEAVASKRVLAWQIAQAMRSQRISKKVMAERLKTSRSQIERLLDPLHVGTTLETATKAAYVLGKRLRIDIVDDPPKPTSGRRSPGRVRAAAKIVRHRSAAKKLA